MPTSSIWFVGGDSGGKTTLCKYVKRAYGLRMLGETARTVIAEYETNFATVRATGEGSSKYQADVFARQVATEDLAEPPYVSDRALDNLAYASENARNFRELHDSVPASYLERMRGGVVFLVRPQQELLLAGSSDSVRARTRWDALQRIDAKVELLLQLWQIPHIVIAECCAARREEMIDWVLQSRGFVKCLLK